MTAAEQDLNVENELPRVDGDVRRAVSRGIAAFFAFAVASLVVYLWRGDVRYLLLFSGIGLVAGFTEFSMARFPAKAQTIRRTLRAPIAIFLVALALAIGVNFQFSGVCFDALNGVVTGALIQLLVARIIIPFVLGNAFCSRVCWDGAFFERIEDSLGKRAEIVKSRKYPFRYPSWMFMFCVGASAAALALWIPPTLSPTARASVFVAENILIIAISFPLARTLGKRAYCRTLCPFLTISSIFSRFSLFKITPIAPEACVSCGKCDEACPMSIPVSARVKENVRISDADCVLCERCVTACPKNCIRVDLPFKSVGFSHQHGCDTFSNRV